MTADAGAREVANHEKRRVALSSVWAAVFLTLMKMVVGIITGSLGILAEATHSGLDLVAAAMTLFAVRASGRPADREHTYGHGKVENLSALFETVLLLVTCVWIIYEAIQRLFFEPVKVEASAWAFVVMLVSIAIDFTRSRALGRVAKKHNSQALEADALHFSTDIWSSSVVIIGLALVRLSGFLGIPWLVQADSVAAMGVAGIVVYVSVRLGRRTIASLLDEVPPEMREQLLEAVRVPGVVDVEQARVRRSGPDAFVDITLTISRDTSLEASHEVASRAEAAVQGILPGADVVVHVEPVRTPDEGLLETVRILAAQHGFGSHSIRIHDVVGSRSLEMHLEVDRTLSVSGAHQKVSELEQALEKALPGIGRVVTHIEPDSHAGAATAATIADERLVWKALESLSADIGTDCHPHDLEVQRHTSGLAVSFHCTVSAAESVAGAHMLAERAEQSLRRRLPDLGRVVIHVEPAEAVNGWPV